MSIDLASLINDYFFEIILLGSVLIVLIVMFIVMISNWVKIRKLSKKYNDLMSGADYGNIEDLVKKCITETKDIKEKYSETELKINNLQRDLIQCIQKVGIVRYNAFDNVGSDLSFCIALLDNNNNGIVLSGIYSRDNSMNYAKPIVDGKSKYALSAEEIQAVDVAIKNSRDISYVSTKK
jgi:hypothetical protein